MAIISTRLVLLTLVFANFFASIAQAESPLFRLFLRPSTRVLFDGAGAPARELIVNKGGSVIWDIRGGDFYRFRTRLSTAEQGAMEEALSRIDARLLETLRSGSALDELTLLRRLAQEELLPRFVRGDGAPVFKETAIDYDFFPPAKSAGFESSRNHFLKLEQDLEAFKNAIETGTSFSGLKAPGIELSRIQEQRHLLIPLNLEKADLRFAQIEATPILSGANLEGAELSYAMLSHSKLTHTNLRKARLVGAEARSSKFYGTDIHGADLRRLDLRGAELTSARGWETANFEGAIFNETTMLPFSSNKAKKLGMIFDDSILGRAGNIR